MNIDDLRTELDVHSRETTARPHSARLADVRARISARRRARVVGGVGLSVAAVVAVVLVPLFGAGTTPEPGPAPPATRPTAPSGSAWRTFPDTVDANPLAASYVAPSGVDVIERTVTLDVLDAHYAQVCRADDPDGVRGGFTVARTSINGVPVNGMSCDPHDTAVGGTSSQIPVAALRDAGVRPGVPFTIRVAVGRRDGERFDVRRLGFALYELTAPTVRSDGVTIPVLQGDGDDRERLVDHVTSPRSGSRELRMTVPESEVSRSVAYGWDVVGSGPGPVRLLVDGRVDAVLLGGGTSYAEAVLDPGEPHVLELRASGDSARGTLLLAVYEPVD